MISDLAVEDIPQSPLCPGRVGSAGLLRDQCEVRLRFLDGRPVIEGLSVDALRGELDRAACWMNRRGDFIDPPLAVVRDVLAMPDYDGIPRLRAVVEAPFVTREGRIIRTAGYHPDIAVYYLADDFDLGDVPTTPTAKDVAHAREQFLSTALPSSAQKIVRLARSGRHQ